MRLRAFVAMPFGTKEGPEGQKIDFNRVYTAYIYPALTAAGLDVVRADQEQRAGDIRTDMFQELLIADLVLADLTIANPNVWYELGVRHALRARGVVIVCGGSVTSAFDVYTDRKLRYSIKGGGPDPDTLKADIESLADMVKETMESWHGRKVSPVYHLLPNLQEPDWKSLRIGAVREFWAQHDSWEGRIELARKDDRVADILVLADEAPVAAFRAEAWIRAGEALSKARRFEFALEYFEKGLEINEGDLTGLRKKGICLERLALAGAPGHSLDRARMHYRKALEAYADDPEIWGLLGRVDKDAWIASWRQPGTSLEQTRKEAADEGVLLRAAIDSYLNGYRRNPSHYYSGINALTLMHVHSDLINNARYEREIASMAGAVRFAAECERDERERYWALATLGDVEVLVGTPETVEMAYREAVAKNDKDWFALYSSRSQLQMLNEVGFRKDNVNAGLETFDRALQKLARPSDAWQPRQVLLFSGHMIDAPGGGRFPSEKAPEAGRKIGEALDRLGANAEDLALTQGACGGDLLFSEACLQRGVRLHWLQPFREPDFLRKSVEHGGNLWRERYFQVKASLAAPIRAAPVELGAPPPNVGEGYPYERCNLWLLYTALAYGVDKVRFVCLWDGGEGRGPGGTAHMYNEVNRRTGRVTWIDVRRL